MNDYRELIVWRCAHELALQIYKVTKLFPREEMFGLTSQLRRAASFVPANIAEGNGRASRKDYLHFLITARGSLNEVRYFVLLSADLNYLSLEIRSELESRADRIARLLQGLIRTLRRPPRK